MAAQYMPKTLAKTLIYIVYHSPGEYGLFWDPNGTMPWKEFYWALQEDESLRFVRESHLKEIDYLRIEMPIVLDGNTIRLKDGRPVPKYSVETTPDRLFYACKRKQCVSIKEHGISSAGRPFLAVSSSREFAVRLAKRRDPDPILIEVLARKAAEQGVVFLKAGPELYLVDSIPVEFLMLPAMREEELARQAVPKKKDKAASKPQMPQSPGSFLMNPKHLESVSQDKSPPDKKKSKGRRGAEWKREARKDRNKRSI